MKLFVKIGVIVLFLSFNSVYISAMDLPLSAQEFYYLKTNDEKIVLLREQQVKKSNKFQELFRDGRTGTKNSPLLVNISQADLEKMPILLDMRREQAEVELGNTALEELATIVRFACQYEMSVLYKQAVKAITLKIVAAYVNAFPEVTSLRELFESHTRRFAQWRHTFSNFNFDRTICNEIANTILNDDEKKELLRLLAVTFPYGNIGEVSEGPLGYAALTHRHLDESLHVDIWDMNILKKITSFEVPPSCIKVLFYTGTRMLIGTSKSIVMYDLISKHSTAIYEASETQQLSDMKWQGGESLCIESTQGTFSVPLVAEKQKGSSLATYEVREKPSSTDCSRSAHNVSITSDNGQVRLWYHSHPDMCDYFGSIPSLKNALFYSVLLAKLKKSRSVRDNFSQQLLGYIFIDCAQWCIQQSKLQENYTKKEELEGKAHEYLQRAANQPNNEHAQVRALLLLGKHMFSSVSLVDRQHYFEQVSKQSTFPRIACKAYMHLASMFLFGAVERRSDSQQAYRYLELAESCADTRLKSRILFKKACIKLMQGETPLALELYRKAAEQSECAITKARAHVALGHIYCGVNGSAIDHEKAEHHFRSAMHQNVHMNSKLAACYALGNMYLVGKGAQNLERAFELFSQLQTFSTFYTALTAYCDDKGIPAFSEEYGEDGSTYAYNEAACRHILTIKDPQDVSPSFARDVYVVEKIIERSPGWIGAMGLVRIAQSYYYGKNGAKAREFFLRAAEQNDDLEARVIAYWYLFILSKSDSEIQDGISYISKIGEIMPFLQLSNEAMQGLVQLKKAAGLVDEEQKKAALILTRLKQRVLIMSLGTLGTLGVSGAAFHALTKKNIAAAQEKRSLEKLSKQPEEKQEVSTKELVRLGCAHYYARGVARDFTQARECFEAASLKEDDVAYRALALYMLAQIYHLGEGVSVDFEKARNLYTSATDQQVNKRIYHAACLKLGDMHCYGQGGPEDREMAISFYEKAGVATSPKDIRVVARLNLGVLFHGGPSSPRDDLRAVTYFNLVIEESTNKLCKAMAHYYLGCHYTHGRGIAQDYAQARRHYELAVDQDLNISIKTDAALSLAHLYFKGQGVPINFEMVKHYCDIVVKCAASKKTIAKAQFMLAVIYTIGDQNIRDYKKAYDLFLSLSLQKHLKSERTTSLLWLGQLYYHGFGVAKDYVKAREYFEDFIMCTGEEGDTSLAFYLLGTLFYHGHGVSVDYERARGCFEIALNSNTCSKTALSGLNFLAIIFWKGQGTEVDYNQARIYFERAAEQTSSAVVQADAWVNLGIMYLTGVLQPDKKSSTDGGSWSFVIGNRESTVDRRIAMARYYLQLASDQKENKIAQATAWVYRGDMCLLDSKDPQNSQRAKEFFLLAAQQNQNEWARDYATKKLESLGRARL